MKEKVEEGGKTKEQEIIRITEREKENSFADEDGIRTHACRAHWISSPTP